MLYALEILVVILIIAVISLAIGFDNLAKKNARLRRTVKTCRKAIALKESAYCELMHEYAEHCKEAADGSV